MEGEMGRVETDRVKMPCSGSSGQPEVRHGLGRPTEFAIQMTRQVMRQDLSPAARLIVSAAAAERPPSVKLAIKQADATLHLAPPPLEPRLLLGGVLHLPAMPETSDPRG
jgi:hypothetical protein